MAVIPLNGARREQLGKGGARKSRAAGQIPGVLYGHGETPVSVAIAARRIRPGHARPHKGGNPLVNLRLDGSEYTALIRDVQYDPLTHHDPASRLPAHLAHRERRSRGARPPHRTARSASRTAAAFSSTIMRAVEVRCLPTAIPSVDRRRRVGAQHRRLDPRARPRRCRTSRSSRDPDATVATVVAPTVMEEKPAEECRGCRDRPSPK